MDENVESDDAVRDGEPVAEADRDAVEETEAIVVIVDCLELSGDALADIVTDAVDRSELDCNSEVVTESVAFDDFEAEEEDEGEAREVTLLGLLVE